MTDKERQLYQHLRSEGNLEAHRKSLPPAPPLVGEVIEIPTAYLKQALVDLEVYLHQSQDLSTLQGASLFAVLLELHNTAVGLLKAKDQL